MSLKEYDLNDTTKLWNFGIMEWKIYCSNINGQKNCVLLSLFCFLHIFLALTLNQWVCPSCPTQQLVYWRRSDKQKTTSSHLGNRYGKFMVILNYKQARWVSSELVESPTEAATNAFLPTADSKLMLLPLQCICTVHAFATHTISCDEIIWLSWGCVTSTYANTHRTQSWTQAHHTTPVHARKHEQQPIHTHANLYTGTPHTLVSTNLHTR